MEDEVDEEKDDGWGSVDFSADAPGMANGVPFAPSVVSAFRAEAAAGKRPAPRMILRLLIMHQAGLEEISVKL